MGKLSFFGQKHRYVELSMDFKSGLAILQELSTCLDRLAGLLPRVYENPRPEEEHRLAIRRWWRVR